MEFQDALKTVYKKTRNKEHLKNPFFVYSKIADLVGNSYEDKKKCMLFFEITKKVNLFNIFIDSGIESRNSCIKKEYKKVENIITADSFCNLVDLVIRIIYPDAIIQAKDKGKNKQIIPLKYKLLLWRYKAKQLMKKIKDKLFLWRYKAKQLMKKIKDKLFLWRYKAKKIIKEYITG